jgi:hypothetical protein
LGWSKAPAGKGQGELGAATRPVRLPAAGPFTRRKPEGVLGV